MTKTLKVIDPFLRLDYGDTFELTADGQNYESSVEENFSDVRDDGSHYTTKYNGKFTISKEYAENMVKEGYLEEVKDKKEFVNIFDEIDNLIEKYGDELKNIEEDWANMPPCLKVEKTTVLENLITVLSHLKGLKKN